MSKFAQWSEKANQLQAVINWSENKNKKDSQSNNFYSLVVQNPHRELFQYCGQAYTGANNYHAPSEAFRPYLQAALKRKGVEIINLAIELMEYDVQKLAVESEDEVMLMMEQIEKAKQTAQK